MPANQYGTAIHWSTLNSPKPVGGIAENYSYRDQVTVNEIEDENLDIAAAALTGRTGEIAFDGTITAASTDLPDISAGASLGITGVTGGTVLVAELVERWAQGQAKAFNMRATHFPHVAGGTGGAAGSFAGLTPVQLAPIIRPGDSVVWGTKGLTSTLGIVRALTITQSVKFSTEMDEEENIVFVAVSGYRRRIALEVAALAAQDAPATNATLTVAGAPAHGGGAFNVSVEQRYAKGRAAIYSIEGLWFPAMVVV